MSHLFIPYFETTRHRVETMIELADVKEGEYAADLGSGDGRLSIALAKKGAKVTGFELDQKFAQKSRLLIQKENLEHKIEIQESDFWNEDLSLFDIITVYPMPDIMADLEAKLQTQLKRGSRVLLNYYSFSSWKPHMVKNNIYQYLID